MRKVPDIARDDKRRAARRGDRRHDGILEIIHRKLPCPLPTRRIEIADLKMPEHAIHRRLRVRLRGMFAHEVVSVVKPCAGHTPVGLLQLAEHDE